MNQVCRLDQLSHPDVDDWAMGMQGGVLGLRKYTQEVKVTWVLTTSAGHSENSGKTQANSKQM